MRLHLDSLDPSWTHHRFSILRRTEAVGSLWSLESFYCSTFLVCNSIPKLHSLLNLSVEVVNPVSCISTRPCSVEEGPRPWVEKLNLSLRCGQRVASG